MNGRRYDVICSYWWTPDPHRGRELFTLPILGPFNAADARAAARHRELIHDWHPHDAEDPIVEIRPHRTDQPIRRGA